MKNRIACCAILLFLSTWLLAQDATDSPGSLNKKERSIVNIAALAAKGEPKALKAALHEGLGSGLTVSQIKEVLIHIYAYCGFPRSVRGLQTFMEVIEDRKSKGLRDQEGREASPVDRSESKYARGRNTLAHLVGSPSGSSVAGYGKFAPIIDTLLKEHLFADLFDRDVLTFAERELVTVSVLSTLWNVEPMLRSHFSICLNLGLTPNQMKDFVRNIKPSVGRRKAKTTSDILNEVLVSRQNKK
jgi:alkylhydroperoxidase/carboxymuconolactone decarboxylase family protein YurZ